MGKKDASSKSIKKRILPTLLISTILPLMICISIPFEIFSNNLEEFLFSAKDFIPILICIALLFIIAIFFSLLFLPETLYKICSTLIISFAFMCFVQSTYLNGNLNSLTGDDVGFGAQSVSMVSKIINLCIWIIMIVSAVTLIILLDKKGIVSTISIIFAVIVFATQTLSMLAISITNGNVFLSKQERLKLNSNEKPYEVLTTRNLTNLSSNKNIFYFCIDRFDEKFAEDALITYPTIYDNLTGFTWFQDNISNFGHTYPAIANMISNIEYDTSVYRTDYLTSAYSQSKTLPLLEEAGYDINLYTQEYYALTNANTLPKSVTNKSPVEILKTTSPILISFKMIQMSLYRVAPSIAKSLFENINSNTCNNYVRQEDASGAEAYSTDMKKVYNHIKDATFSSQEKNNFSFIHLEGCHTILYNDNWEPFKTNNPADVSVTVKQSFSIINKYINAMKDLGVYDSATIIITGDHAKHPLDESKGLVAPALTALFVKPSNSSNEPLKTSSAQVSHSNIWATIVKSASIETSVDFGKSVFEINESDSPTRKFVWHTYYDPLFEYIYEIKGKGSNFNNWKVVDTKQYNRFIEN